MLKKILLIVFIGISIFTINKSIKTEIKKDIKKDYNFDELYLDCKG